MIEAVNASISTATVLRNVANAGSPSVESGASNTVKTAPKAPYISPFIAVDPSYNKAVILIRNAETGNVEQQYPTKNRLDRLRQDQARQENLQPETAFQSQSLSQRETVTSEDTLVSVQEVISSAPANTTAPAPQAQAAIAALSAGAQSGQTAESAGLSVLA